MDHLSCMGASDGGWKVRAEAKAASALADSTASRITNKT